MKFEVQETYEEQDFAAMIRAVWYQKEITQRFPKFQRAVYVLGGIGCLLLSANGFYQLLMGNSKYVNPDKGVLSMLFPCILFLFVGLYLLMGRQDSHILARRTWRNYEDKGKRHRFLFEENKPYAERVGSNEQLYSYHDLLNVLEDEEHFFLMTKQNVVPILRKDSFQTGTPEEFRAFLEKRTGQPVRRIPKTKKFMLQIRR